MLRGDAMGKRSRRSVGGLLAFAAAAGLLIWTKLRLVTDIPRSVYADPKEQQADGPPDAADRGGTGGDSPAGSGDEPRGGPRRPGG